MRRNPGSTLALVGSLLALGATAAPSFAGASTSYELGPESAWLEGCIVGPCLCPIAFYDELSGGFELVELPTLQPGPSRLFEVRDIRWELRQGNAIVEIRGSGLYETAAPVLDEHRLILNLTLDGEPIEPLDSGTVEGGLAFPIIDVRTLTPGECYQQGILLSAYPLGPTPTPKPAPEPPEVVLLVAGVAFLSVLYRRRIRKLRVH